MRSFKYFFVRVSVQDQILFAKHLAIMTKAGMPLLNSLLLIQKQTKSRSFLAILKKVVIDVDNGQFLSTSLEQYRGVFGDLFINVIRVGEASGTLVENLNYLALELSKQQELRRTIKGALMYPLIILLATLGIVGALIFLVFPKIMPVFKSLNLQLPLPTRILIDMNLFFLNYWPFIFIGFIIFVFVFWGLLQIRSFRKTLHHVFLYLPIIGTVVQSVNMANFARTFGVLLRSGVKIVESLTISSSTLSNLVYQDELQNAAGEITKGIQISQYLSHRQHLFPIMLSQMVEVGENTGNLSETLIYISDYYESEVNATTKNLTNILEPFLLIFMGVMVGFVAIAIIMPIYGITQGLKVR